MSTESSPEFHIENAVPLEIYEPQLVISDDCQINCAKVRGGLAETEYRARAMTAPGKLVMTVCPRGDGVDPTTGNIDRSGGCLALPVVLEPIPVETEGVTEGPAETPVNWRVSEKQLFTQFELKNARNKAGDEPIYTDPASFLAISLAAAAMPARSRHRR